MENKHLHVGQKVKINRPGSGIEAWTERAEIVYLFTNDPVAIIRVDGEGLAQRILETQYIKK